MAHPSSTRARALPPSGPVQHVLIGEIRSASQGVLTAALGSCVAIGLINPETGMCGLAHCFLPAAPINEEAVDGRYADHAVDNLLRAVVTKQRETRRLRGFLAGGARLIGRDSALNDVGSMNIAAARASLQAHRIFFQEFDTGGLEGCRVLLNCETFEITTTRIPAPSSHKTSSGVASRQLSSRPPRSTPSQPSASHPLDPRERDRRERDQSESD